MERKEEEEILGPGKLIVRPNLSSGSTYHGRSHEIHYSSSNRSSNACIFTTKITHVAPTILAFSNLEAKIQFGGRKIPIEEPLLFLFLDMFFKESEHWIKELKCDKGIIFSSLKHFTEVAVENGWRLERPSIVMDSNKATKEFRK
jgi:hypothetical protein